VERLYDAAAHPLVAEALNSQAVLTCIQNFKDGHGTNHAVRAAVTGLQDRIKGWDKFNKLISGQSTDATGLPQWLRDITSDDMTCGVFVYWIVQEDVLSQIQESSARSPSGHIWLSNSLPSCADFFGLLRAVVGVSLTLVVFCWAEDVSKGSCSEQIVSLIRLWQEVEGYREVFIVYFSVDGFLS